MKKSTHALLVMTLVLLPCGAARACTPVATFIFVGGTVPFAALLFKSFLAIGLAVAIKSALFAWSAGYSPTRSVVDMVVGNIASTIPGIMIAVLIGSSAATLLGLGIGLLVIGAVAGRLLTRLGGLERPVLRGYRLAMLTCLAMIISVCMFGFIEQTDISDRGTPAAYWMLKYVGVFFGLLSTLAISTIFEGAIILGMHQKPDARFVEKNVLNAIIRANLLTLLIMSLLGAAYTIPTRIQSEGFLFIN